MSKPIDTLMQKKMTRGEFVATLGLAMASLVGLSHIIQLLTGKSLTHQGVHSSSGYGYGNSPYGRSKA